MELFGQTERRLLDMYQVYLGMAERMKKYAGWTIYVVLLYDVSRQQTGVLRQGECDLLVPILVQHQGPGQGQAERQVSLGP